MNENIGNNAQSKKPPYVILSNRSNRRTRLGWVSSSTGLTYCGICLRAAVPPEMGESCPACGATIIHVFQIGIDSDSIRNIWRILQRQTTRFDKQKVS